MIAFCSCGRTHQWPDDITAVCPCGRVLEAQTRMELYRLMKQKQKQLKLICNTPRTIILRSST